MVSLLLSDWIGLFFTWAIFSYLIYKETAFYRFAEHTFIGVAGAIALTLSVKSFRDNTLTPLFQGKMVYLVGIILGLVFFLRLSDKYRFISNWTVAFYTGVGLALYLRILPTRYLITPIKATIQPLNNFNNLVLMIGMISTILYFYFTRYKSDMINNSVSNIGRLGRVFLMVAFGATFGGAVLGRMSMLIERIYFTLRVLGIAK